MEKSSHCFSIILSLLQQQDLIARTMSPLIDVYSKCCNIIGLVNVSTPILEKLLFRNG